MALTRLYPPILAGTIPSFYKTSTGTSLEVPFSMNTTVSQNEVRGIQLRLKTTSTDIVLANVESTTFSANADNRVATFELADEVVKKLVIGNFYKVQIAYNSYKGITGYYSTVAIVKYTDKPTVGISGLNAQGVSSIISNNVVGIYSNSDTSEKVYQYRFRLMNIDSEILEDSGWLIHNSQLDDSLSESQDSFTFQATLNSNTTYKLQYSIITNNGLEVSSVIYDINQIFSNSAALAITLKGETDNENGRVILSVRPSKEKELAFSGTFVFSRREKDSLLWDTLATVSLNRMISETEPYIFMDYAIESGASYVYSVQKVNSANIYSYRTLTWDDIIPAFEDIFLFDGKKQLRVRFNPTISSFKSVVSETKKTTLGRQYPFMLRNGILDYKEFPINGLISYLMDNDELFMSKTELDTNWDESFETTDLTDANFGYERKFKLAVLEWLNNGEVKLFKSPQEGCYLVRLSNVSLSPNTTVSRMLHTFSCTATEIDAFSVSALQQYNISDSAEDTIYGTSTEIINLNDYRNTLNVSIVDTTRKVIKIRYEKYNGALYGDYYGLSFSWGDINFAISESGTYEIELDDYVQAPLYMYLTNLHGSQATHLGYLYVTYAEAQEVDSFNYVEEVITQPIYGLSAYGLDETIGTTEWEDVNGVTHTDKFSRNILEDWDNLKTSLDSITYIEYKYVPVLDSAGISAKAFWTDTLYCADLVYGDHVLVKVQGFKDDSKPVYYRRNLSADIDDDNAFTIVDYGVGVLFGNVKRDLDQMSSSEVDYDFHTDFPRDNNGNLMLRIQSGVQVCIYGSGSDTVYSVERNDDKLIELSEKEDKAYEEYLRRLFNFIATEDYIEDDILYIYENRQFSQIIYSQAAEYVKNGYTIYTPYYSSKYNYGIIVGAQNAYKEWTYIRNGLSNSISAALPKEE